MKALPAAALAVLVPLSLLGACSGVDRSPNDDTTIAEGPCPGSIGRAEAVRLAKRFAEEQHRNYHQGHVRAGWSGAYWSVAIGVHGDGESKLAFVDVAADGSVIGCESNVTGKGCGPKRTFPKGSCLSADASVPTAKQALEIAAEHLEAYSVTVDGSYESADWYGANWWVLLLPEPLYVDGHYTVHVSPDGTEFDLTGAFTMYSEHGFVRRPPGDETRPISSVEAIERARAWLRDHGMTWQEDRVRTSWISDQWHVTFVGSPPGPDGDVGLTVAWDGKVVDHIRYHGPDTSLDSCPDQGEFWKSDA